MYIVSGCFAGMKCRYDGKDCKKAEIIKLIEAGNAIPLCPEMLGELPIPRVPCEQQIINGEIRIIGKDGNDYTEEFNVGNQIILRIVESLQIKGAILQEKSPSCGVHKVYDGTFSGQLISGNGLMTKLFKEHEIEVMTHEEYLETCYNSSRE